MSELNGARRLRSREWFDNPDNPWMTALYLERYLNYGLTLEELAIEIQPRVTASSALPGIRLEKLMSVEIEVEVNCRSFCNSAAKLVVPVCVQDRCSIDEELRSIWN